MVVSKLLKDCTSSKPMPIEKFPSSAKLVDRQRLPDQVPRDLVCDLASSALGVLKEELQSRFFVNRPSNSRLVLGYMSKQSVPSKWLTQQQIELAKTCYLMMLRQAVELSGAGGSAAHKKKKQRMSPRLQKRRSLIDESDSEDGFAEVARTACEDTSPEDSDAVSSEVDRWKHLPREVYAKFSDSDGVINEFQLMSHVVPAHRLPTSFYRLQAVRRASPARGQRGEGLLLGWTSC